MGRVVPLLRTSKLPIPRLIQQLLAAVLIALIASPAWSQNQVAGTVLTSQSATMGNAPLPSGSTIFSGESVAVDDSRCHGDSAQTWHEVERRRGERRERRLGCDGSL